MNQQMCLLLLVHITGAPNKRKIKEKSWEHLYEDWTVNLLTSGPIFCKHRNLIQTVGVQASAIRMAAQTLAYSPTCWMLPVF